MKQILEGLFQSEQQQTDSERKQIQINPYKQSFISFFPPESHNLVSYVCESNIQLFMMRDFKKKPSPKSHQESLQLQQFLHKTLQNTLHTKKEEPSSCPGICGSNQNDSGISHEKPQQSKGNRTFLKFWKKRSVNPGNSTSNENIFKEMKVK